MRLLGDGFDDPRSQANMALAAGLLGGSFRQGLLGANQAFIDAGERKRKGAFDDLRMQEAQMRMEQLRREADQERLIGDAARSSFITPENANARSMGPMPDGSNLPTVQPGFNVQQFLSQLGPIAPLKALEWQQKLAKDNSPLTVAPGASLVDRTTLKPVFTAPKEAPPPPAAIQEYQFAVGQGFKGTFQDWDMARKKAGATNVSVPVNVSTEKSFLTSMGEGFGKAIPAARDGATAALGTINTVNRLMDALDSGKVMAGPGSTFRQTGLQIGSLLGVGGKDAQETLINTRQAIQSLAQLELDAAQQMKGQGQITEAERSIIRRAASGDIDGMTVPELRLLGGVLDRSARTKVRHYRSQVEPLRTNPNAAPLVPFLDVPEPEQRKPKGAGGVRKFNPATGRIE